jgi:hypothetical protein
MYEAEDSMGNNGRVLGRSEKLADKKQPGRGERV